MCFFASASFGAGAALTAIDVFAIRKTGKSSERLFSVIPLLFAGQQFIQGFLWLSFNA